MVPLGALIAADVSLAIRFVLITYRAGVKLNAFFCINLRGKNKAAYNNRLSGKCIKIDRDCGTCEKPFFVGTLLVGDAK